MLDPGFTASLHRWHAACLLSLPLRLPTQCIPAPRPSPTWGSEGPSQIGWLRQIPKGIWEETIASRLEANPFRCKVCFARTSDNKASPSNLPPVCFNMCGVDGPKRRRETPCATCTWETKEQNWDLFETSWCKMTDPTKLFTIWLPTWLTVTRKNYGVSNRKAIEKQCWMSFICRHSETMIAISGQNVVYVVGQDTCS